MAFMMSLNLVLQSCLALWSPRLGKTELLYMLQRVCVFFFLFFFLFLFFLVSGVGCGLLLLYSVDFSFNVLHRR